MRPLRIDSHYSKLAPARDTSPLHLSFPMTQINTSALVRLREVIGGSAEDLAEFIDDFNDLAREQIGVMQQAAQSRDWNALKIASHSLKSSSKDFGADELAELCAALERESSQGDVDDAVAKVEQIASEAKRALAALKELDLSAL